MGPGRPHFSEELAYIASLLLRKAPRNDYYFRSSDNFLQHNRDPLTLPVHHFLTAYVLKNKKIALGHARERLVNGLSEKGVTFPALGAVAEQS
jgi:hypothetical protein